MSGQAVRVGVIMATHNRLATTTACLDELAEQEYEQPVRLHVYVTDDGSTDGTREMLKEQPETTVIEGDGTLFWAASMARSEDRALADHPDYLLWLNDDVRLDPDAITRLLSCAQDMPGTIVVGATRDPDTGQATYGGRRRVDAHPQHLPRIPLSDSVQRCDSFNGNCVLVPIDVARRVGPIDGSFPHGFADTDYGLRATALRIPIAQVPGSVGLCRRNPDPLPPAGGLLTRWRWLELPKNWPVSAQYRYLRRHAPWIWPAVLAGGIARRLTVPADRFTP